MLNAATVRRIPEANVEVEPRQEISLSQSTDEGGQVRERKRAAQPHASATRATGVLAGLPVLVTGLSSYEETYIVERTEEDRGAQQRSSQAE